MTKFELGLEYHWNLFLMSNVPISIKLTINSLAPRRNSYNLKSELFKIISMIIILSFFYEIGLRWTPEDLRND